MADNASFVTQAIELIDAGHFHDAIVLLSTWVDVNTEDAKAWELLGKAYFDSGDWVSAKSAMERAIRLRPDSASAWCNIGTVLRKLGELAKAGEAQQRALMLDPNLRRAKVEAAKVEKALAADFVLSNDKSKPASCNETTTYYCQSCHHHIAQAIAEENEGLCAECLKASVSANLHHDDARRQGTVGWRVAVAVLSLIIIMLTIGRHGIQREGHQIDDSPTRTTDEAATIPSPANPPTAASRDKLDKKQQAGATSQSLSKSTGQAQNIPIPTRPPTPPQRKGDPYELMLKAQIDGYEARAERHVDRARKYKEDARTARMKGYPSSAVARWKIAQLAELEAAQRCWDLRDKACYDLARYWIGKRPMSEVISLLQLVEESQGGTTSLGAAARKQLQQLGYW
jgi:tetratricopeptide (TPR) repeat protein